LDNLSEPAPLPEVINQLSPQAIKDSFWSARRRRPAFLIILTIGLVLFFILIPSWTRESLWAALNTQRELVVLLIVFALVTLSLIWSAGQRMDARVFIFFNARYHPLWLDRFMWLTTQLGNMLAAVLVAIIFFLLNDRRLAVEIIFGAITLWLLVETIKALADRDRPFLTLEAARVIGWKERGDSFPSGHTSQIFFLATLFIQHFLLGVPASAALYAVAGLVGFTRVYVGAHYPRDVIAGVVLGTVWGLLAILVNPYWSIFGFL